MSLRNPLTSLRDLLTGRRADKTDPHPVRGWEQPLEEQQAPADGEPARKAD